MKNKQHFGGKIVWITGASSGIGEALARKLDEAGAQLVLSSDEPEPLEEVRRSLAGASRHLALPLDLAEHHTLPAKAQEVLGLFGRVDILFNNGGIGFRALARNTLLEVDRRIMDVDYFGHVALTKAVLPSMLARRGGHIVVTSSVMGLMAAPWRSAYCAAKHALVGFFDTLRAEIWADNIRITIICPAAVATKISFNALTGTGEKYGRMSELLASGISPEACAREMLEAVRKGRREAVVGKGAPVFGVYLRRFLPGLYFRMLRRAKVL
ncbi:MAG: SDR family NAD(P)-dependent oxidoreductase [bacterium]